MPPPALGVIADPVSARDIRRVVAHAGNLQISERVNIVIRVLQAARAAGVERALLMPDRAGTTPYSSATSSAAIRSCR
jgi:predicted polyphosphate/ATP-dependent NAD kinase